MRKIDLNCDLGESFGTYKLGDDAQVLSSITSANVACSWHAGDPVVMQRTVELCAQKGVSIGAHPGYPDLMGFGRRNMVITPDEARAYVKYQIGALRAFCDGEGVPLVHVKPHGALYNAMAKDEKLARGVCQGVLDCGKELILYALAGSRGAHISDE